MELFSAVNALGSNTLLVGGSFEAMVSSVIIILFTALIILVTLWYMKWIKYNKYLHKYPGPPPLPLIGNAHEFRNSVVVIPALMEFQKKLGGVMKFMLGFKPRLAIADPKFAEFFLSSTTILTKSYEYRYLHAWLGTGLLTSASRKWKQQRKIITPAFHFQILEQFIEVFDSQSDILVEKLSKEVDGPAFDVFPYITLCALDVICEASMGTNVNAQNDSDSEYVNSVKEMCRIVTDRVLTPVKMVDFLYKFSKDYQKERKALKILHGYTDSVIRQRRNELTNRIKNIETNDDDDTGIKRKLAFLDLLLQCTVNGKPLSDLEIRQEVDTFMFEGHDTTTSAISFALYCLSKHPQVQDKVVDELKCIFGNDKNRSATYNDLQEMKYLEMVIKESLRMFPPVPFYARILDEDVEFNGEILPKGLAITLFSYGLHRREEIYPEPEKFDPERFSPENSNGRSPYAYLPFSAGPRNCIGQRFAMLEMKSALSKVLRKYEILPVIDHKPILITDVILKSVNGLPVYLRKRLF